MKKDASRRDVANVTARIERLGRQVHLSEGDERTIIGVLGEGRAIDREGFEAMDGVDQVMAVASPFKLASRDFRPVDTVVALNGSKPGRQPGPCIGGEQVIVMAGPCSVESREQILETARAVRAAGATVLRGGAFKPRSSPYSFQGLGLEGLKFLAEAREETGLLVVTEVMSPERVPLVSTYADILQIGARNMQNYDLLHAVGQSQRPVMLKRGMMSTMEELLMSAEYILSHGNDRLMLCERGIRTFETYTRNTLDINAVPMLKKLTHLPVVVDPSHGTGKWDLVGPVARAAVAAGADGIIVEVHPRPEEALSDGGQSLKPDTFAELMVQLRAIAQAVGRTL
jgi:3-deoxy-7-phosphoheptulonate synthase